MSYVAHEFFSVAGASTTPNAAPQRSWDRTEHAQSGLGGRAALELPTAQPVCTSHLEMPVSRPAACGHARGADLHESPAVAHAASWEDDLVDRIVLLRHRSYFGGESGRRPISGALA